MRSRVLLATVATACTLAGALPAAAAQRTDHERARAALLRLDDLSSNWHSSPAASSRTSPCSVIERAKDATSARADGRDFSSSQGTDLNQKVYVYRSTARARSTLRDFGSSRLRRCLVTATREATRNPPKGARYGAIHASALSVRHLGDAAVGTRVALGIRQGSAARAAIYDFVFVRVGRALSLTFFYSVAPDLALETRIAAHGADRLAAAMR